MSNFCKTQFFRRAAVVLIVLAWSNVAFCGEIHDAAKNGDLEKVRALLKANPDLVNSKDTNSRYDGYTPLHSAVEKRQKEMVELLLANKADVNANVSSVGSPLHLAAARGYMDMVELLLANKAKVNAKNNDGDTPMHLAAGNGKQDVVELLRQHGGQDEVATTPDIMILVATRRGDIEKVKELLKGDSHLVSSKDSDGLMPLHLAAEWGHKDEAELLLASKADVNAKDKWGDTPLHWTAVYGHKDVAELLLASKAGVNAKNNDGNTTLHLVAIYNYKEVAELLLTNRADINAKNKEGNTPLQLAVSKGNKDMADLFRQHGGHE